MRATFRTDANNSFLKPAEPHVVERSSDAPTETLSRAKVTIRKPYKAAVTIVSPAAVPRQDTQSK